MGGGQPSKVFLKPTSAMGKRKNFWNWKVFFEYESICSIGKDQKEL